VHPRRRGRSGGYARAQPIEVSERDHVDQLRVACGSGQEFVGHERRSFRSSVGELLVFLRESIDRQHDPIAVAGKGPLVDTAACLGISIEAFGDEAVHEPRGLADAGQDAMAEDRQGGGSTSECAAKPPAKISDDNFTDPLRARGHAGGEPRLPLDCGDGDPVVQKEAVAMALATGSAFGPVTAAAMPTALGKMVLPRFGGSTTTASASEAASGAMMWKVTR
jgi:hypothetical protein